MNKAKCNIFCDGKSFVMGEEYSDKQIAGQFLGDFEVVEKTKADKTPSMQEIAVKKDENFQSLTNESLKGLKKTNKKS